MKNHASRKKTEAEGLRRLNEELKRNAAKKISKQPTKKTK
jgi:hypothetical protein